MAPYLALLPEALVGVAALVALFGELLPGEDASAARIGALASVAAAVLVATGVFARHSLFGGMLLFGPAATFVRTAVPALTAVFLLWVSGRGFGSKRYREAVSLVLFATLGGMIVSSAADLIVLYMGLETATMPSYVLMGYRRNDERGLEGALKYYLMSILTSLLMVYGFSFIFGLSGSTAYSALDLKGSGGVGLMAVLLVAAGLSAKLSAAPFHFWAPDAYEGAPAASVAFVSTVPKVAALAGFARLAGVLYKSVPALGLGLALVAAASMLLGNLAAYPQTDLRRLMAYSGIAHSGYLMVALSAGTGAGVRAAVFYALAYAMPSLGIMLVAAEEGVDLERISGLAKRRPWLAATMVVFLLSLVGIPPVAGFIGKLYVFGSALDSGRVLLVVLGVLMSAVSAGYYFRVVRAVYFPSEEAAKEPVTPRPSRPASFAVGLLLAGTVLVGVLASPLLSVLGSKLP